MRLLCLLVMGASGIVWEIEPHQEDDITPSPYILSFSKLNIILFLNHVYLLINLFCFKYFWETNSIYSAGKINAKCQLPSGPPTKWMYEVAQQISVVSHTVLFLLLYPSPPCCTALIIHCLLPLSALCSRQVILDLCFWVMLCDKLYEVCSRSTDTIASIALPVTLNFLSLFF